MALKDILVMLWLALAISIGINYFWGPQTKQLSTREQDLNTEIDFIDIKPETFKPIATTITTPSMELVFSSEGATIERLAFKHPVAQGYEYIDTIFPPTTQERERGAFLVAFDQGTPFYYFLIDRKESEEAIDLTYRATFDKGTITKIFTIYKNKYQINLDLNIESAPDVKVHPRILFPAPVLASHKDEGLSGITESDSKKKLTIIKKTEELVNSYWNQPTIFGAQNIYFIHAMVADKNSSLKRGFFKLDNTLLIAILECGAERGGMHSIFSFYCGPKEERALMAVDPRLVDTIDYGWFAPVGRMMLKALNALYSYTHNYGWAIVLLTLIIRLLLLPFTLRAERSMKRGADMGRKLQALERKYKDNPEQLEQEKLALLKKEGFGMGGCLGILVQIPVLIALSYVLRNAIQLYRAPFIGWIKDLSIPDPFYVLPVLVGVSMISGGNPRDMQQRLATLIGALILAAFSATWPAGLTLYLFVSTAAGVAQSYLQRRLYPQ